MKLMNFKGLTMGSSTRSYGIMVHIDDVVYEKLHYQLYSINDFYVEVHYDAISIRS